MTTQSIYLAARYSRREEMCRYREQLRGLCYDVTSRWIDGLHILSKEAAADEHGNQGLGATERGQFAAVDFEDVQDADTIIAFTELPRTASRGGRHVELGIAIGQGKRVIVVGHRENVFCCLPRVEFFPTWEAALQQLQIERAVRDAMVARGLAEHNEQVLREIREKVYRLGSSLDRPNPVQGNSILRREPRAAMVISSMANHHDTELGAWEAEGGRPMPEGGSDAR